jgi:hypothetical protein
VTFSVFWLYVAESHLLVEPSLHFVGRIPDGRYSLEYALNDLPYKALLRVSGGRLAETIRMC